MFLEKQFKKGDAMELVNQIIKNEKQEDVDFFIKYVMDNLNSFTGYFNAVYDDVNGMHTNKLLRDSERISQEEFERRITESDRKRRLAHNVAIDACHGLNRLCDKYGISHICPEDDASREEIAEFIGSYVTEIYNEGIGKGKNPLHFDRLVENTDKPLENAKLPDLA